MSGRIYRIPAAALADALMREMEETAQLDAREPLELLEQTGEVDFAGALQAIDAHAQAHAHAQVAHSPAAPAPASDFSLAGLDLTDAVDWLRRRLSEGPRFAEELITLWQEADGGRPLSYEIATEIMFAAADALKVGWRALNDAGEGLQWRLQDADEDESAATPPPPTPPQAYFAGAATPQVALPFVAPRPRLVPKDSGCMCEKCMHKRISGAFADMRREDLATHAQLISAWGITWPYDNNHTKFN